jgi:hypothetical protein
MQVQAQLPVIETATVAATPAKAPKAKAATVKRPAKEATAKVEAPAKKAGAATKAKPKAAKATNPVAFTLMKGPSSGGLLYAFTDAVLRVTGLYDGKSIDKATLTKIVKATAVRYHLTSTMAFELDAKGNVRLSKGGKAFFAERAGKFSKDDSAKYESILLTGKPNDLCKNKDMINKVA